MCWRYHHCSVIRHGLLISENSQHFMPLSHPSPSLRESLSCLTQVFFFLSPPFRRVPCLLGGPQMHCRIRNLSKEEDKTGGMGSRSRQRQAGFHPVWKPHVVGNGWQVGAECGGHEPRGVRAYWRTFCVSPRSWDLISTWRKHGLCCLPPKL